MKVAVVGYGYWGPNLVRNFSWTKGVEVKWVCDKDPSQLDRVSQMFPNVTHKTSNYDEVLQDPETKAVAISTPTRSHFALAKAALEAGKHVLVEKPMTETTAQAKELVELAQKKGLVLMTDHTFVYTGAVKKIKELITQGDLGEIYYFDSVRVNLGLFQNDVNVIWDLAPHDLSILLYCLEKEPVAISAQGMAHVDGQPENIAYLTCHFADKTIAHCHLNWLSPIKIRLIMIGGSKKMLVWDDMVNTEKVKIYEAGVHLDQNRENVYQALVRYRTGDMWAPKLDGAEALKVECAHFIDCIENHKEPLTSGRFGMVIVAMLEAAQKSLQAQGKTIPLDIA